MSFLFLGVQWQVAAQRCVFTLSVICFWSYEAEQGKRMNMSDQER